MAAALDGASLEQALSLVHDELHKGDVEAAHRLLHRALGVEDGGIDPNGKKYFRGFDIAFNTACRKNNVAAAYVIFDPCDPENPRSMRVLAGGDVFAADLMKRIIEAGRHAVAEAVK